MADSELLPDEPGPAPAWQAWLETAALCVLAVAAGAIADRHDPSMLRRGLAWLALAPLLAGLRYGAGHGVACGATLMAALLAAARWDRTLGEAPAAELALWWLCAGLLPGQFRDVWARRLRQVEAEAGDLRLRLGALVRSHHALKVSHDRLQREAPGCPVTLRDALEAFQRELGQWPESGPPESFGGRILALFQECASVRAATLHWLDRRGGAGPAVAALGPRAGSGPDGGDPLIREAARLGEVVSVRDLGAGRDVVAAVPLVDAGGRVRAVVAIRELPFPSLHADTLALLGVLGGHAGDVLARAQRPAAPAAAEKPLRSVCSTGRGLEAPARGNGLAP